MITSRDMCYAKGESSSSHGVVACFVSKQGSRCSCPVLRCSTFSTREDYGRCSTPRPRQSPSFSADCVSLPEEDAGKGILLRANSLTETSRNLESWHNPKSISATQALHDRFQSNSMKHGQNPLVALTDLEEMASQLSQQNFYMASNQSLIRFLSILPESEYEVEKRTFYNGPQPVREQVLMAIRSRFENLQRAARRVEEGRTPGTLSWPTLEGGLAGHTIPRQVSYFKAFFWSSIDVYFGRYLRILCFPQYSAVNTTRSINHISQDF